MARGRQAAKIPFSIPKDSISLMAKPVPPRSSGLQPCRKRRDSEFDLHLNNGRLLEHFHEEQS